MQPRRRQCHDLVAGGFVYIAVLGQQPRSTELNPQLLQVSDGGRDLDLRQCGGGVATLDQRGDFGSPEALA